MRIEGKKYRRNALLIILAQLHGNEPAGLAGILLAMAMADAGKLERDVIGAIGNPLAARQYFEAHGQMLSACTGKEERDCYRCGLDANDGALLPDGNRIPVDFLASALRPAPHHQTRAGALFALAQLSSGILDIHSARGNMVCITDHKADSDLKDSPIRAVLTGAGRGHFRARVRRRDGADASKPFCSTLPNMKNQTGIEAARHESSRSAAQRRVVHACRYCIRWSITKVRAAIYAKKMASSKR